METKDNKNKEKNKNIVIYAILILALIATWAYIYWDKSKSNQKQDELQAQVIQNDSSRAAMKDQYQATLVKLDMLKSENDSLMETKSKEIDDLKAKIQHILSKQKASSAELTEARSLIKKLKSRVSGYKKEIERLKGENVQLVAQRDSIQYQRDSIQTNLDSMSIQNDSLNQQVEVASVLKASHFNITPIHVKNSGKEKSTKKAKKTDIIRISFNIDKNRVTASGEKELYICVNSPQGTPIAVKKLGSGKFTLHDGTEKLYTLKKTIDYETGKQQKVSVDWKQPSDFQSGEYTIMVYEKGREIGKGSVNLKEGWFIF